MNDLPMCNDVVTILPTLLITVAADDIKELSTEEKQMLKNNTEMMMTDEDVMLIYLENLYWKRYKHAMVDNVIRDKFDHRPVDEPDLPKYHDSGHFSQFMMDHGCYVFSGSGLRFPEIIEEPRNPYDVEEPKKHIGFGKTYKPAKSYIDEARRKAQAKLDGHKTKQPKTAFK